LARKQASGTTYERRSVAFNLNVAAQYYAWHSDAAGLRRLLEEMRRVSFPGDTLELTKERDNLALVVDAQLAVMTKRADAPSLMARLDSLLKAEGQGQVMLVGTWVAARGWEALGDAPRALAALRRSEGDGAPQFYYSTLLRERGRLAAITGDRDLAIRSYRQYLTLRANPDPPLKAQADQVRAELQRLESQRAK
jgi:hypothetical protein